MKTTTRTSTWIILSLVALLSAFGCSKDDSDDSAEEADTSTVAGSGTTGAGSISLSGIPLLTPSVKKAVPAGLVSSGSSLGLVDLSSSNFTGRFFTTGPTDIFGILATIDERIVGINERSQQNNPACLTQAPVEYTIEAMGQTLDFYGQCTEVLSSSNPDDPSLVEFATVADVTYLYMAVGAQRIAAILTPISGTAGDYSVQAWLGVGYLNEGNCGTSLSFDGCSYGVIQLSADPSSASFEMSVAGVGIGYCGAQLKSDGVSIYAFGSEDAPDNECAEPASLCVEAADMSVASECSAIETFDLPALGRDSVSGDKEHAASLYPNIPNVVLTGEAGDSLDFGPTAPTAGLGAF